MLRGLLIKIGRTIQEQQVAFGENVCQSTKRRGKSVEKSAFVKVAEELVGAEEEAQIRKERAPG